MAETETDTENAARTGPERLLNGWRFAGWGAAAAVLAVPAIAMRFTGQVDWTAGDFLFAAILLAALGVAIELTVRVARTGLHRTAMIAASLAGFLTFWINAAVGIVGDGPINIAFFAMVLLAVVAGFLVRFRAEAMTVVTGAMVVGEIAVGLVAEFTFQPDWGPVLFMAFLWLIPTLLFRQAAAD